MKNILVIFFLFLCYNVVAQQRYPVGPPTQFSTGYFKQGYHQSDSGTIIANRDTNWLAKYSGTIVFKPSNKKFYWFDSTTLLWHQFADNIDTTSLSNRINLKLNISDTSLMLAPYLRKADTTNKWVQDVYVRNDSLFKFKNGAETFIDTLGNGGGSGSGLTSVGLSMPSAFTVTNSPLTVNGTISVSGAGTALQYIRGNGTLATTDSGMIPNFYLKVRGLLSGTSPITYNSTTGAIGITNANTTGTKGAATFTSAFSDNGSGTIDLSSLVSAGSCSGCNLNIDINGRITSYADGAGGATNNVNVGSGIRPVNVSTQEMRTYFNGFGIRLDTVSNANGITWSADTARATGLPTYWYTDSLFASLGSITADNGLTKTSNNIQWGGTLIQDATVDGTASYISTFTASSGLTLRALNTGNGNVFGAIASGSGTAVVAQGNTGKGILASSVNQYGISTISTSNIGIYSGTTSGVAAGAFETNPSSTNTTATILQLKRYTSGTAANGIAGAIEFITEPSSGTVDVTTGYIVSKLTDATFATRTSSMEFHTTNNTVTAVKASLSGPGLWNWAGYPASTAQIDTTTFKPLAIDGSGNVVKMIGWSGSGGGGATFPDGLLAATSNTPRVANDSDVVNTMNQYLLLHNPFRTGKTDSIYFFGDSYTAGSGASQTQFRWTSLFAFRMGGVEVNHGVAGGTLMKRVPIDYQGAPNMIDLLPLVPVKTFNRKMLVFAYGLNDMGQTAPAYTTASYKTDYDSVMHYCINQGWQPNEILIVPPYWIGFLGYQFYATLTGNAAPTVQRHTDFVFATQQVASKWGTMYFDIFNDQLRNDTTLISASDHIHPTDAGYEYIEWDVSKYFSPSMNTLIGTATPASVSNPLAINTGAAYSNSAGDPSKLKIATYYDGNANLNFGLGVANQSFEFFAGGSTTNYDFYLNGNTTPVMRVGPGNFANIRLLLDQNVSSIGAAVPNFLTLGGTYNTVAGDTVNPKLRVYDVLTGGTFGLTLSSQAPGTGQAEFVAPWNCPYDFYIGPAMVARINRSNLLIPNLKIRAAADSAGTATGGYVFRDAATGDFKITQAPGGIGITSINSQTGASQTLAADNGLTATTTTNTVTYTLGGTLTGFTQIAGGSNSLLLGTSGSHLSGLTVYGDVINLLGNARYGTEDYSTDADHTVSSSVTFEELHDNLTTNRTLTMPSASQQGQILTIITRFSAGSNHFNLASAITDNSTGTTFTQLDWGKRYDFYVNSSLAWILISKY